MTNNVIIPQLSDLDFEEGFAQAVSSGRHRHPKLLHQPGDQFNRVFNFIMSDSYMRPHLHPGEQKIEEIYIIEGRMATIFFDDRGDLRDVLVLEKGGVECITVPAFTWHTYVTLTDTVVTYETMTGVYDPKTWKEFPSWAPVEGGEESSAYLAFLKKIVNKQLSSNQDGKSRKCRDLNEQ